MRLRDLENPGDTTGSIASKIFHGITEGLQDTLKIMNETALEQAINTILSAAQRIDAYGSGGSAIIAADIKHRFMRFGIPVRAYADPYIQITSASLLKPGDVAIAISHTGANRDILDAVEMAKTSKATVISITSYMRSPLSKTADITLYGMAREVNYRSEAMASRLIHLAIIDVLYVGALLKQQDRFIDNMQKVRQAIAKRRI
ncbi:MurR/RpiR family transcriptional regulator [Sporomusa carbonis]|uniref:MurR/RpiR family transcriptional regulator n=1 Tax=Sporomusa carbonis TaxID=3076075 RepID=UPI003C79FFF2